MSVDAISPRSQASGRLPISATAVCPSFRRAFITAMNVHPNIFTHIRPTVPQSHPLLCFLNRSVCGVLGLMVILYDPGGQFFLFG